MGLSRWEHLFTSSRSVVACTRWSAGSFSPWSNGECDGTRDKERVAGDWREMTRAGRQIVVSGWAGTVRSSSLGSEPTDDQAPDQWIIPLTSLVSSGTWTIERSPPLKTEGRVRCRRLPISRVKPSRRKVLRRISSTIPKIDTK